ncbi:transcription termination/antitermination NusG family protein [Thermoanaerobacter sp. YS13]|uniref:transcription termination/antitermination NusG family protein n=1 Tax=Thermoanaerobacter sp. YS13 TaxID=1511746 RepID=UPI000A62AC75|nr:transcription termination/antitermination NusG family protein [Thermoanaerobacter sp. YS13]
MILGTFVRNTRGVTGFVGPGSKPVPLSEAEVRALGIKEIPTAVDLNVKDTVRLFQDLLRILLE